MKKPNEIAKAIEKEFLIEEKIRKNPLEFVDYFRRLLSLNEKRYHNEDQLNNIGSWKMHPFFMLYQSCYAEAFLDSTKVKLSKRQVMSAFRQTCKHFKLNTPLTDPYYIESVLKRILTHRSPGKKPYLGTELHILVPRTAYLIGRYGYKIAYNAMTAYILLETTETTRKWILKGILLPDEIMSI